MGFNESLLAFPNSRRIYAVAGALRSGKSVEELYNLTRITPWFLEQIKEIVDFEKEISSEKTLSAETLLRAKRLGFTDKTIAHLRNTKEIEIYKMRESLNLRPGFLKVDTCAGEFASDTPYFYSTYWSPQVQRAKEKDIVVILGSGPNRIGQGIEFDYGCVRAVKQFRHQKMKVIMVNSNPETVSTDYDTSDELYFEPLTGEHVLEVFKFTNPMGFMAQLGGQTPINIARHLVDGGYPVLGSSLESIDLAEDRGRFAKICQELKFKIPASGMATDFNEATKISNQIGFPIICRPSYVLGGRRMEIVENLDELKDYFERNGDVIGADSPCLIDEFIEGALEVDVDLVRGKDWSLIGGILKPPVYIAAIAWA
jgi:carbamoyl-phosphate synthase large subunit